MKRVVITGLGAITPIGKTSNEYWEGLINGKCGIDEITLFDTSNFKVKLAAEVKNFNVEEYLDRKEAKRLDRYSHFGLIAAREAMKDAKIDINIINQERFGIGVSSGIGGLQTIEDNDKVITEKGPDRVSPFFIPMSINNMAAGNIAIDLGAKGECFSMTSACASATDTIGECYRKIKHGYQDIMIAGGTEACITPLAIAGFTNIRALSQNTNRLRASIPFDKERDGFVMGEGAGVVVLEELEHAKERGAKIYAEIVGYGATSDAYHITSPSPDGKGGARAMQIAMQQAEIKPEEVTYINAHGTSTPLNDKFETIAVKEAFKEASKNVAMSSTKGHTGHLLGAAGGIEAIACIKSIQEGIIPATIGYKVEDMDCDLDIVPNKPRRLEVKYAMSNSLGFGGHNSSILFKKYDA